MNNEMTGSKPAEELHLTITLPIAANIVYNAWVSNTGHRDFTGANAVIQARNGGNFSVCDGYITGIILKLEPGRRIIQSWRTADFHPLDPSSTVEVIFEDVPAGTRLILHHTDIPAGLSRQINEGWVVSYFEPMLGYFSHLSAQQRKNLDRGA
jgi:uncharacterized protein YndB with AHSA1/START domain